MIGLKMSTLLRTKEMWKDFTKHSWEEEVFSLSPSQCSMKSRIKAVIFVFKRRNLELQWVNNCTFQLIPTHASLASKSDICNDMSGGHIIPLIDYASLNYVFCHLQPKDF